MKIKIKNEVKLQIIQPDLAHKAQTIIFFSIGIVGTISVVFSGEGLANGIFFYLLLLVSYIWFRYGGKPDMATFDKEKKTLEMVEFKGTFSKPKISIIKLEDIKSCELDGTHFINAAWGGTNRKTFAILLFLDNGKKICILPYTNGKKRCEAVFNEVKAFIAK